MNSQINPNSAGNDEYLPAISNAEFQSLIEMVGGDDTEVLLDLLDTYLVESSGLVDTMRSATASGDQSGALRAAHSLKSSSASIGALRLSRLCADLEAFLRSGLPELDVPSQVQTIEGEFARVEAELGAVMDDLRG